MTTFLEKLDELESQSRKAIQIEKRYKGIPVNIPEMYIRPEIAIKLIEALKRAHEAMKLSVARADDYADSYLSQPIRQALQEIEEMFK